jgi:hypothetical protein
MAEDTSGASQAANGEQPPADEEEQARQEDLRLEINTQYVKDLSFENPNAPLIYTETPEGPELEVQIDVATNRLHERVFEVVLKTRIVAKVKDKVAFLVELEYAGWNMPGSSPWAQGFQRRTSSPCCRSRRRAISSPSPAQFYRTPPGTAASRRC